MNKEILDKFSPKAKAEIKRIEKRLIELRKELVELDKLDDRIEELEKEEKIKGGLL